MWKKLIWGYLPKYVWICILVGSPFVIYELSALKTGFITVGLAIAGGGFLLWRSKLFERRLESTEEQIKTAKEQIKIANRQFAYQGWRDARKLLRADNERTRIWGLRDLGEIAQDNLEDRGKVTMKIFCDFIRERLYELDAATERKFPHKLPEEIGIGLKAAASLKEAMIREGKIDRAKTHEIFDLGKANFHSAALSGADFRGANLLNANFSKANLEYTNFSKAILRGTNFSGATLWKINFSGADMKAATFTDKTSLSEVDFNEANLRKANFEGAEIWIDSICKAKMIEAKFGRDTEFSPKYTPSEESPAANPMYREFVECDLRGSAFSGVDLSYVKFEKCDLTGAKFTSGANLSHVKFEKCNLTQVDFKDADFGSDERHKKQCLSDSFFTLLSFARPGDGIFKLAGLPHTLLSAGVGKPEFLEPKEVKSRGLPLNESEYQDWLKPAKSPRKRAEKDA